MVDIFFDLINGKNVVDNVTHWINDSSGASCKWTDGVTTSAFYLNDYYLIGLVTWNLIIVYELLVLKKGIWMIDW